jgi:phage baseplate assembly protein W
MSTEKRLISRTVVPGTNKTTIVGTRAYKGISTVSGTSRFALYDIDLIKQDIINHFHIRQGEKLENPEFGTIIWDLLFEPLTEDIKELIVQNVTNIINYDPRVKVEAITVSQYESGIQIECELTYLPYNISESLRYRFDQENGILG